MHRDYPPTCVLMRSVFTACAVLITATIVAFIDMLADDRFTHAVLAAGSIVVFNSRRRIMIAIANRTFVRRLLTLGCLFFAFLGQPASAQGGGSPDPGATPVLQALRVQVSGLDQDLLAVTHGVEPVDLPVLTQLADELARIDAHFALAAVGGGTPDPSGTTLNQTLLALRAEAYKVREHVGYALAKAAGNPTLAQITKTLRFMQATARMLIARVDYALPASLTPPSDL